MRNIIFAVLLPVILVLSACASSDTTEPPTPLEPFTAEAEFKKLWSVNTGGVGKFQAQLKPFFSGDRIYTVSPKGQLSAFEKSDGKLLWRVKTGYEVVGGVGGGDGLLFFSSSDGELLAYWQKNGEMAWKVRLSSEMLAVPAVNLGVVITRTVDGNVQALSISTGEKIWSYKYSVPTLSLRGTSSPVVFAGGVLTGTDNGRLTALAVLDGRLLWESTVAVPSGRSELSRLVDIDVPVIIDRGVIYAASYQGRVVAINLEGGQVAWARDASTFQEVSLDDSNLYLLDEDSHVWGFNRLVGSTVWMQDKLHARPATGTAVNGDSVLVGDFEGYLHALDAVDGRFIARKKINKSGISVVPFVDDGVIYVLAKDGGLSALTLTAVAAK